MGNPTQSTLTKELALPPQSVVLDAFKNSGTSPYLMWKWFQAISTNVSELLANQETSESSTVSLPPGLSRTLTINENQITVGAGADQQLMVANIPEGTLIPLLNWVEFSATFVFGDTTAGLTQEVVLLIGDNEVFSTSDLRLDGAGSLHGRIFATSAGIINVHLEFIGRASTIGAKPASAILEMDTGLIIPIQFFGSVVGATTITQDFLGTVLYPPPT